MRKPYPNEQLKRERHSYNEPQFGHEKVLNHSYFVKGIRHSNFLSSVKDNNELTIGDGKFRLLVMKLTLVQ